MLGVDGRCAGALARGRRGSGRSVEVHRSSADVEAVRGRLAGLPSPPPFSSFLLLLPVLSLLLLSSLFSSRSGAGQWDEAVEEARWCWSGVRGLPG